MTNTTMPTIKRPRPGANLNLPCKINATTESIPSSSKSMTGLIKAASKATVPTKKVQDGWSVHAYLTYGEFHYAVSLRYPSTKERGWFIRKEMPEALVFPADLRSNCAWLYAALNVPGHPASDILDVLGISRIEDFESSDHPTVIRREYRKAKKKADALG